MTPPYEFFSKSTFSKSPLYAPLRRWTDSLSKKFDPALGNLFKNFDTP